MIGLLIVPGRASSLAPLNESRHECFLPVLDRTSFDLNLSALCSVAESVFVLSDSDTALIESAIEGHKGLRLISYADWSHVSDGIDDLIFVRANAYMSDEAFGQVRVDESCGVCGVDGRLVAGHLHGDDVATFDPSHLEQLAVAVSERADVIDFVYPWNVLEANVCALAKLESGQEGATVEDGAVLKGAVFIGPGTLVKSGTYIEGPVYIGSDCVIGPSAYLRPDTVICDRVTLGHAVEIYDSVVFEDTTGKHRSYIGHSIIGAGVNLGCGFITSDYRHDGATHRTLIDGKVCDSGRRKLGAFLGDGVMTGIHTSVYPGRKIWGGCTTLPGEIVKSDVGRVG